MQGSSNWQHDPTWRPSAEEAHAFARCAFRVLQTPFPYAMQHLTLDAGDRPLPQDVHPLFGNSYDWHSSVHMHWSLLRLRRLAWIADLDAEIDDWFSTRFVAPALARERAYFETPGRAQFERPYGWVWYWMLTAEARCLGAELRARGLAQPEWIDRLIPLAETLIPPFLHYLQAAQFPERAGTHRNSAFACILARAAAAALGWPHLADACADAAKRWFAQDAAYPAAYEPSGSDFLSPGMVEATLMADVLEPGSAAWQAWWHRFQPHGVLAWQQPVPVADRLDPQGVHLDGLNLSRAWCWRRLGAQGVWPQDEASGFALRHWSAAREHVAGGDFVATHWLASFALLALSGDSLGSV
jgi:Protein of unknown function (DUF2891)